MKKKREKDFPLNWFPYLSMSAIYELSTPTYKKELSLECEQ